MGILANSNTGRYSKTLNQQIYIQTQLQQQIKKEMKKYRKYGSRDNIFGRVTNIQDVRFRKTAIPTPKKQMELFFGWIKETKDKRTRVLGKAFIRNDFKVPRETPLQQWERWKKPNPFNENKKFDYDFSNLTEADVMLLESEEEAKWSHLNESVYGLFKKFNAKAIMEEKRKEYLDILNFLSNVPTTHVAPEVECGFEDEESYYNADFIKEEAKELLNSLSKTEVLERIESGEYVMRLIETKRYKLINTFNTKFYTPEYFMKMIDVNTIGREDQFFLTSVVYRKRGETAESEIRRLKRITELPLLFAELDYYKVPALEGFTEDQVVKMIQNALKEAGFPPFTQIIFSGRGIHLYWLINPIGEFKLKKWDFMQNHIHKILKPFGADANAKDAMRILRLIGSINGRNKEEVRGFTYTKERYDFDSMFETFCRADYEEAKKERLEKRLKASQNKVVALVDNGKWMKKNGYVDEDGNYTDKYDKSAFNPQRSFYHRYHQLILNDLTTLVTLRNGDMEGYRNSLFFITYNYALRVYKTKEEAIEFVKEVYDLLTVTEYNFEKYLYHAKSAEQGHEKWLKNKTQGYNYSTKRLIELFGITRDEMQSMFTLVDDDIKYELKKEREKARITNKRRENGVKTHKEKKEEVLQAISKARDTLLADGKKASYGAISKATGLSKGTIFNYLKTIE